jgi:hypothetical protein
MSNNPAFLKVPDLTEENFITWHPTITTCLCQCGLWQVVTGKLSLPKEPELLEVVAPATVLTNLEKATNTALTMDYEHKLDTWNNKDKKAQGKILAAISATQHVHLKGTDSTYEQWQVLLKVHMQSIPGTCFLAYNELFSITKQANKMLPAVSACVKHALAHVKELCPDTVTVITARLSTTKPYSIKHLDNELVLMAMLWTLLHNKYGDFVLSLMHTKDLMCQDVEAAFQVKQTKCNAQHGPLITPASNKALCTQQDSQNAAPCKPNVKCMFCNASRHMQEQCFAKERTTKAAKAKTKEVKANINCLCNQFDTIGKNIVEIAASPNMRYVCVLQGFLLIATINTKDFQRNIACMCCNVGKVAMFNYFE